MLTIGSYSLFNQPVGAERVASIMSLFGLIHFEGVIFFIGTATFILSLVKERREAASRAEVRWDFIIFVGTVWV